MTSHVRKLADDLEASGGRSFPGIAAELRAAIESDEREKGEAVTEEMVERLAQIIVRREARNCKSVDLMYHHESKWRRAVPEAREILTDLFAALQHAGERK